MWLELELDTKGEEVTVSGRGSRGESPPPHTLPPDEGLDAMQSFSNKVGRAVRGGRGLDQPVVEAAQALYQAVLKGELRDVFLRLSEAAKEAKQGPLLIRIFAGDRALQAIPWEALCKPGTNEGFLGTDPKLFIARGVLSSDPWEPREIRGAVRVLAIAPGSSDRSLLALNEALAPAIEAGEVEWLDPIAGPDISPRVLFDRLRRGKTPHIVHFLGHGGVDLSGKPVLRMADDEDEEEVWLTAEALGRELGANFCAETRLVILEACEGAKAAALGSAAEILAKAGADAVVAHLWPVKVDVARTCSTELYRMLTGADNGMGDIGASVAAARRTLLTQSAEAFSPILYLRGGDSDSEGADTAIFNFKGRRVAKPGGKRKSKSLAPALQTLLEGQFTLVVGDLHEDHGPLIQEITQFMKENEDEPEAGMTLSQLTQRCVLRFGQEMVHALFQQASASTLPTAPPVIQAMGRLAKPGVHFSLLWDPHVEQAIAEKQPERTVYTILQGAGGKARVVKRPAGKPQWKMELSMPKRFELEEEIVVLRLYGGYSPEAVPIFSAPLVTEDDHIQGLLGHEGFRPPGWMEVLLARPRIQPGLFMGLSVLEQRHRFLLKWLYDQRQAPKDSLALLAPNVDSREAEIWEGGAGLPGRGRIAPITEDPEQLASLLDAFGPEDAR